MALTRRQLIEAMAGTTGVAGFQSRRPSGQPRYLRRFIIPAVDQFEGNYAGQFLFVDEHTEADVGDVPVGECEFADWSAGETGVYEAQLLDRRQEVPVAVDLPAYTNGSKAPVEPATHFIINEATQCPGDYVGIEGEWVTRRALVGKPPGPTVTSTDEATETGGQPGFGWLVGGTGLVVGLLAHAYDRWRS